MDRIRNAMIRERVGFTPIEDKLKETRLRWFGHVKRMIENEPVSKCEMISILGFRRGRGQSKKVGTRWLEMI